MNKRKYLALCSTAAISIAAITSSIPLLIKNTTTINVNQVNGNNILKNNNLPRIAINDTVQSNGLTINSTIAPYELTEQGIKELIVKHQNDIFIDIQTNITVESITAITWTCTSTSITVTTTIDGAEYTFTINGFVNKDTFVNEAIINEGIAASGGLEHYSASEVESAILDNISTYDVLRKTFQDFINANAKDIFTNLPELQQDETYTVLISDNYGEYVEKTESSIKFKFSMFPSYINGKMVTEQDFNPEETIDEQYLKTFEINLIDLNTRTTSAVITISADSSISSLSPSELSQEQLKQFVVDNYTKIFSDQVGDKIVVDDIKSISSSVVSSTSANVTVTIPVYENGSTVEKEFSFELSGLTNKDTILTQTSIVASNNLLNHTSSELISNYQNYESDIKDLISSLSNNIFENYKPLPIDVSKITINSVESVVGDLTAVKVNFTISGCTNNGIANQNKEFSINITGLIDPATLGETVLTYNGVSYSESNFNTLFNGYSSFFDDWDDAVCANAAESIKSYLNTNYKTCFKNYPESSNNIVNNVTKSSVTDNAVVFNVQYTGNDANAQQVTLNATFTVTLQPTPTFNELFSSALTQSSFEQWIKDNNKTMPEDSATAATLIKEYISVILEEKKQNNQIPQNFDTNTITIDDSKIIVNSSGIQIESGAITVNGLTNGNISINPNNTPVNNNTNNNNYDEGGEWIPIVIGISAAGIFVLIVLIVVVAIIRYNHKSSY